jgi:starch phosphorylase
VDKSDILTLKLPQRIERLYELASNLWWSWHTEARDLFRALDYPQWKLTGHNPVKQIRSISPHKLQAAATDPAFLILYDSVMAQFDLDMSPKDTWVAANYPELLRNPIAFFSMEFATHSSLPIYAGGLGVLAGDLCKEASDLGLPLVAVGFMYPEGYFQQCISPEGWQQETCQLIDFATAPISQVMSPKGTTAIAQVQLGNVAVSLGAWLVQLGRTRIYLLDTDIEENPRAYRQLSARLYVADPELRLQQEIVLGVGGVRVLRALDFKPIVWHGNEGHTAFMMMERVREEVAGGLSLTQAVNRVQATTVFTTHTPVVAGHDVFPEQLVEKYLTDYWKSLGIDRETFLRIGQWDGASGQFNMTAVALRLANQRNAVSKIHETVTRKMWHSLWPKAAEDQVPIYAVTNGIHAPTWIAPELNQLFEKYIGKDWLKNHDNPKTWDRIWDIPDGEMWETHALLKRKLKGVILDRERKHFIGAHLAPQQMLTSGTLLDPEALTIGFVRRFTEYKRPMLIFRDIERLKRILTNPLRPVQIVFAGKSHPADSASKYLLHQVYVLASSPDFDGRIAFIEDYNLHLAHYLVQGTDVWLNNPRRGQEACGTSGMKAALNGVLHLSVLDGWWREGYNGTNGWSIGDDLRAIKPEAEDEVDADTLYRLLEEEIVPLYYDRDRGGVPHGWMQLVKESVRSIAPVFCARRMLKEYTQRMYIPATRM